MLARVRARVPAGVLAEAQSDPRATTQPQPSSNPGPLRCSAVQPGSGAWRRAVPSPSTRPPHSQVCHGDLDEGGAFFLGFEDAEGSLDTLSLSRLHKLLAPADLVRSTRLVFVSACHSQPAAEVFAACGVPHVVGVRSDAKVLDVILKFTTLYYIILPTTLYTVLPCTQYTTVYCSILQYTTVYCTIHLILQYTALYY